MVELDLSWYASSRLKTNVVTQAVSGAAHHFPPIFHAATHDWVFSKNLLAYDVRERLT